MDADKMFQTMPLRFRVWDKVLERFVIYKDIYPQSSVPDQIEFEIKDLVTLYKSHPHAPVVISQDTGLKDKNGKNIYTGDILVDDEEIIDGRLLVEYNPDAARVEFTGSGSHKPEEIVEFADTFLIIGNIWQNPELLEAK